MRTINRLEEVYQSSERIPFDDHSRIVFFSDIHRGDNSVTDEFGQNRHIYYHALQYYYDDNFTYVEVGDGDELWETRRYRYIYSSHGMIFDMLRKFQKDNRMIMLYGNHNMQIKDPGYVRKHMTSTFDDFLGMDVDILPGLVPHEAITFKHSETGQEIFVCHGNQGDLLNDQMWKVSFFLVRYLWRFLHHIGIKYAATPSASQYKSHRVERNYNKWLKNNDVLLICGHTHRAKFPNNYDDRYFNSGCCIHPRGVMCIELAFGEIALVQWTVHTRRDGMMYIKRSLVKGPEEVSSFIHEKKEVEKTSEAAKTKKESTR